MLMRLLGALRCRNVLTLGSVVAVGLALTAVSLVWLPSEIAAGAGTDTVTNCNDSGPGSLRQAVASAASGDTIVFAGSATSCSPIVLSSGPIDVATNLTISGPGASSLAVSGENAVSVFQVNQGISVNISGITIENGSIPNCGACDQPTDAGAGILNQGTLTLTSSVLSSNSAPQTGGGGIANTGTLNVSDTMFSANSAVNGGAINNQGTLIVANSTFSGNSGSGNCGGICNSGSLTVSDSTFSTNSSTFGGGIDNFSSATITNSTFSGNSATDYGGGLLNNTNSKATITSSTFSGNSADFGGGIAIIEGTMSLGATIVANTTSGSDCGATDATVTDLGYNLDDDGTCGFSTSDHDLPDTNPLLDPSGLKNNGGPTQTIALEPGSPAVGHVSNSSLCPATDQRGVPRSVPCDIGAWDLGAATLPPAIVSFTVVPNAVSGAGGPVTVNVVVSNAMACTLSGSPGILGLPITSTKCSVGSLRLTLSIPSNPAASPAQYQITVTATGAAGTPSATATQVVTQSAGCVTTSDVSQGDGDSPQYDLPLPLGIATPNPYDVMSYSGSIKQCVSQLGLTTSFNLSDIAPQSIMLSPAGYAALDYGFGYEDNPACASNAFTPDAPPCSGGLFGSTSPDLTLTQFAGYSAFATYSLGSPSPGSLPYDLIYDVFLERNPAVGSTPQSGDIEVEVYLDSNFITPGLVPPCLSVPMTFEDNVQTPVNGALATVSQNWQMCKTPGLAGSATTVSIWPQSAAWGTSNGSVSVPLADFLTRAANLVKGTAAGYYVTGVSLGTEYDACYDITLWRFAEMGCMPATFTWSWTIGDFYLEGPAGQKYTIVGPG